MVIEFALSIQKILNKTLQSKNISISKQKYIKYRNSSTIQTEKLVHCDKLESCHIQFLLNCLVCVCF